MAGGQMTLMDVVDAGQQGIAWAQQNERVQRERKRMAAMDEANAAMANGLKQAEDEDRSLQLQTWMSAGNPEVEFKPKPFQPADSTMLKLGAQRTSKLYQGGLIDEAVKNEGALQGQRLRVRQNALARFKATGGTDYAGLARAINDTVPDGRDIVEATTIEGAPGVIGSPDIGTLAAIPTKVRFKYSDGTEHSVTPEEIVQSALALADPKHAENEAALYLAREKARIEGEMRKDVDNVRTKNDVRVKERESELAGSLADKKHGQAVELATLNNASDEKQAGIRSSGGGRGGGGGSGAAGNFAKFIDQPDGTILAIRRGGDGKGVLVLGPDGKPARSSQVNKRIDSMARDLMREDKYDDKPFAEWREIARGTVMSELARESERGAAPGAPSGSLADAPKPSEKPAATPAKTDAKKLTALPAGSKQIGTYQGKKVYQTPDGKRVLED